MKLSKYFIQIFLFIQICFLSGFPVGVPPTAISFLLALAFHFICRCSLGAHPAQLRACADASTQLSCELVNRVLHHSHGLLERHVGTVVLLRQSLHSAGCSSHRARAAVEPSCAYGGHGSEVRSNHEKVCSLVFIKHPPSDNHG